MNSRVQISFLLLVYVLLLIFSKSDHVFFWLLSYSLSLCLWVGNFSLNGNLDTRKVGSAYQAG